MPHLANFTMRLSAERVMPSDSEEGKYRVGYRKPPLHSRFKRGESGNKQGRRKGSRNPSVIIHDELNQRLFVTEAGKRRSITKWQAVIKQLLNKAATGEMKATRILVQIVKELGELKLPASQKIRPVITMQLPEIRPGEDRSYRDGWVEPGNIANPDPEDQTD